MSAGVIGPVAVWLAIGLSVVALVTGRRRVLVISALAGAAATVVLTVALLAGDFSLAYVAETTSLATPWPYRLAALWGGMDGSMLFYTVLIMGIGAMVLERPVPIRVIAAVGLGLLSITVFFANPFTVLDLPAVDGGGLLAILQHPAMIYHPPILYLGLTTLVVPFALTVELVTTRGDRVAWMSRVRRWMYISWTLLIFGMTAGANWAYVELGWGGFWAWDPVENTALMPWLAATVFLHSSRIEAATGRWRRWNVMFAGLAFALTLMGVYLTRSGATGSIHSFAEDPVVGRILLTSAAIVAVYVLFAAVRSEIGESWGEPRLDRNGWMALNALLLGAALVFITAGSAYPAFASVFGRETVAVDSRFFVVTIVPIAVAISLSLAVALRRSWLGFAIAAAVGAAVSLVIVGPRVGVLVMAPALASLALLAFVLVRGRVPLRRVGAHLAHLGMAMLLAAVAASSFGADFSGTMRPGDSVTVGGHEVTLQAVETGEADRYVFVRADLELDGSPISPEIRAYEDQATPVAEPALRPGFVDDVIIATSLLFPDGNTVEVSVFVRPLVTWVWVGAMVLGLAGLFGLFGRGGDVSAPRPQARATPLAGETTTGTAAR